MPQQLIFTSAPRGLVAGRAGFCTVAMSAGMREALALRLEQISYFDHAMAGAHEQVIRAARLIELRGSRYFVLSRIQDCGLDFTQRTNFIAHHLVFSAEEISEVATPPEIFRQWNSWLSRWDGEPRQFSNEDWGNLYAIPSRQPPARCWARLAGDAMNAFALLETPGLVLNVEGLGDDTVLDLFAESLALLEAREARDFRMAAWQFTFTTALQGHDNLTDFRWRCVRGDPAAWTNLGSTRALALPELRPTRVSVSEASFARSGYQPPKIIGQPRDTNTSEGENVMLRVEVTGVPAPTRFQWFNISRTGTEEPIAQASGPEVSLRPARGMNRYCVKISNPRGDTVTSRVVQVSVDAAVRVPSVQAPRTASSLASVQQSPRAVKEWIADPLEAEAFKLKAEETERRRGRVKMLLLTVGIFGFVGAGVGFFVWKHPDLFTNRQKSMPLLPPGSNGPAVAERDAPKSNVAGSPSHLLQEPAPPDIHLIAALVGGNKKAQIGGSNAKAFASLFNTNTHGLKFSTADFGGTNVLAAPDIALIPGEIVTSSWNNASVTFKGGKKIEISVTTNVSLPRVFAFASSSNELFRVLLWNAPVNERASIDGGEIRLDGPIVSALARSLCEPPLATEFVLLNVTQRVASVITATNWMILFESRLKLHELDLKDLQQQLAALSLVSEFRAALKAKGLVSSAEGFWDEIDQLCQLAAHGNVRGQPFGFSGGGKQPLFAGKKDVASIAFRAISEANSNFKGEAEKMLDANNINLLERIRIDNRLPISITDAQTGLDRELLRLRSNGSRLSVAIRRKDTPFTPLITFTVPDK